MTQTSPTVQDPFAMAAEEAIELITQIHDPVDRAFAYETLVRDTLPRLQVRLRVERVSAIREAMRTRTAVEVAEELGISRARLYQLLAGDVTTDD